MANPDLAFGALFKKSRFDRDMAKHERRTQKQAQTRKDEIRDRIEWALVVLDVWTRDKERCRVCGRLTKTVGLNPKTRATAHHVVYRSAGGSDELWNLATVCGQCHADEHDHKIAINGRADGTLTIQQFDPETGTVLHTFESPNPSA